MNNSSRLPAKATPPALIVTSLITSPDTPASATAITDLAHLLIPADLRKWMDAPTLAGLVTNALATIAPDTRTVDTCSPAAPGQSPKVLMAVLTYSYAVGNLMSETIADEVQTDPVLQEMCGDDLPVEAELRQFRRACRHRIQECLAKVLELAWDVRRTLVAGVLFGLSPSPSVDQRLTGSPDFLLPQRKSPTTPRFPRLGRATSSTFLAATRTAVPIPVSVTAR